MQTKKMVPKVGFEPTQAYAYGALNTACLPVPPLRHDKRQFNTGKARLRQCGIPRHAVTSGGVEPAQVGGCPP